MPGILEALLLLIDRLLQKAKLDQSKRRVPRDAASVGNGLKVNGISQVSGNTHIGNNVHFNGMLIRGKGKVVFGDNFHSGQECLIITDTHNYDSGNKIPYDETYIVKDVTIEDNVWLGSRVTILGGVTIGEGAIVQAGSVVVSDIPAFGIAGGHPAKLFRYRDKEHYLSLKEAKQFY